jgi:hypothetical protein
VVLGVAGLPITLDDGALDVDAPAGREVARRLHDRLLRGDEHERILARFVVVVEREQRRRERGARDAVGSAVHVRDRRRRLDVHLVGAVAHLDQDQSRHVLRDGRRVTADLRDRRLIARQQPAIRRADDARRAARTADPDGGADRGVHGPAACDAVAALGKLRRLEVAVERELEVEVRHSVVGRAPLERSELAARELSELFARREVRDGRVCGVVARQEDAHVVVDAGGTAETGERVALDADPEIALAQERSAGEPGCTELQIEPLSLERKRIGNGFRRGHSGQGSLLRVG